jgi:hypothetical protein
MRPIKVKAKQQVVCVECSKEPHSAQEVTSEHKGEAGRTQTQPFSWMWLHTKGDEVQAN